MASKFTELAIGCAGTSGLAGLWCAVVCNEVQDEDDGAAARPARDAGRPGLGF